MKHHLIILSVVVAIAALPAKAQKDTIVTLGGQRLGVTVKGFSDNSQGHFVKVSPFTNERGQTVSRISGRMVDRIEFSDGFVLKMDEGEIVRDNILEAPRYKGSMTNIEMEGVLPLTKEETLSLLGDSAYHLGLVPYRRQVRIGLVKSIASIPAIAFLTFSGFKMTEYYSGYFGGLGSSDYGYFEGEKQKPGNALLLCGTVTGVLGFIEAEIAQLRINSLAEDFKDFNGPSVQNSWRHVGVGAGLTGAGIGMIAYGTWLMANKGEWYDEWTHLPNGTMNHTKHEGEKAGPLWIIPLSGAIVANLGLAELTYGVNCLHGHSVLRKMGMDSLTASLGPTPSGFGLQIVF